MEDTQPEALRVFLDLNHRLPAQRKFELLFEMSESINATYAAQERQANPAADDREIFLRVAERRLGSDVVRKAYGWAPAPR